MRVEFTRKTRAEAFARCGGKCEGCGARLKAGEGEYDHRIPCAHGGEATLENCQVLCRGCHKAKTARNKAETERAKRRADKHSGAWKPSSRPIPGSRNTPFKRKINGETVRREGKR